MDRSAEQGMFLKTSGKNGDWIAAETGDESFLGAQLKAVTSADAADLRSVCRGTRRCCWHLLSERWKRCD